MFAPDRRMATEFDLRTARRRAAQYLPYSPAWDAATARIEDLERELSAIERMSPSLKERASIGITAFISPAGRSSVIG